MTNPKTKPKPKSLCASAPLRETQISDDAALGEALTLQYQRAVSGMREVLIFGAMLMQIAAKLSALGQLRPGRPSKDSNGITIKAWLAEFAPTISRPTAYRFLGITKAVEEEYAAVVGVKIARKFTLPDLVTAAPESLPEPARAKQLELFDYVAGTSQRSWLDRFALPGERGGDVTPRDENGRRIIHKKTWEQLRDEHRERMLRWAKEMTHLIADGSYQILSDAELLGVSELAEELKSVIREWREMTVAERRQRALAPIREAFEK